MSVLRYDETSGLPFKALPHGGFHRLSAGDTVILVDTGKPLSARLSAAAHAGCLSFELSSGRNRFIVNSGSPRFAGERLRQLARTTAAHTTVCIGDVSSARVANSPRLGPIMVSGPSQIQVDGRRARWSSDRLSARHDGYVKRFGVIHEREIRLNEQGTKIAGRDRCFCLTACRRPICLPPKLSRASIYTPRSRSSGPTNARCASLHRMAKAGPSPFRSGRSASVKMSSLPMSRVSGPRNSWRSCSKGRKSGGFWRITRDRGDLAVSSRVKLC